MVCMRGNSPLPQRRTHRRTGCLLIVLIAPLYVGGCGDNVRAPTVDQIAAFEAAAPIVPPVDMDRINRAKLYTGPYRVVPGDVLEFIMPALLRAVTEAEIRSARVQNAREEPFICRVSDEGTIALPAVGELDAAGKSLAEIEAEAIRAYASYAVNRPSIYVRVLEYRTSRIYIGGVVEKPGVYTLRADQMTLVSLLTEAGGIAAAGAAVVRVIGSNVEEAALEKAASSVSEPTLVEPATTTPGASPAVSPRSTATRLSVPSWSSVHMAASPRIRATVRSQPPDETASSARALETTDSHDRVVPSHPMPDERPGPDEEPEHATIVLPVVGMNVPFKDVSLAEGDTVVVEPVQMPLISVVGLVRNPGNFEYPPHARYNLAQVIALAGGLDMDVDPRYATVYRLKPDGTILRLAFRLIEDEQYTDRFNVSVRPGDLVAIEHTPRTRTAAFINRVVRLSVGTWIDIGDLWNND